MSIAIKEKSADRNCERASIYLDKIARDFAEAACHPSCLPFDWKALPLLDRDGWDSRAQSYNCYDFTLNHQDSPWTDLGELTISRYFPSEPDDRFYYHQNRFNDSDVPFRKFAQSARYLAERDGLKSTGHELKADLYHYPAALFLRDGKDAAGNQRDFHWYSLRRFDEKEEEPGFCWATKPGGYELRTSGNILRNSQGNLAWIFGDAASRNYEHFAGFYQVPHNICDDLTNDFLECESESRSATGKRLQPCI